MRLIDILKEIEEIEKFLAEADSYKLRLEDLKKEYKKIIQREARRLENEDC